MGACGGLEKMKNEGRFRWALVYHCSMYIPGGASCAVEVEKAFSFLVADVKEDVLSRERSTSSSTQKKGHLAIIDQDTPQPSMRSNRHQYSNPLYAEGCSPPRRASTYPFV